MLRARGDSQEVGRGQRVFPELGPRHSKKPRQLED